MQALVDSLQDSRDRVADGQFITQDDINTMQVALDTLLSLVVMPKRECHKCHVCPTARVEQDAVDNIQLSLHKLDVGAVIDSDVPPPNVTYKNTFV